MEQLGIDETSFLAANRSHATVYATGLVDLQAKVVIDMVEGNAAPDDKGSAGSPAHAVNLKGNRRLNHALHIVAVTQSAHDCARRRYYEQGS